MVGKGFAWTTLCVVTVLIVVQMAFHLTREALLDDLYRECLKSSERRTAMQTEGHFVSSSLCQR